MMKNTCLWLWLLPCLLIQACTTTQIAPVVDRTSTSVAPVVSNIPRETAPQPVLPAPHAVPAQPAPAPNPPVITALLDEAEQVEAKGDAESAAATLERALKIEPKNALLWNRLAGVRMRQGNMQQALTMARKSNSLAAGNHELQLENWYLILSIQTKIGDAKGMEQARKKIEELRRQGAGATG